MPTDQETKNEVREKYYVTVSYNQPTSGTISVPARDADHAHEMIMEMLKDQQGVNVIDVVNSKDVKHEEETNEENKDNG